MMGPSVVFVVIGFVLVVAIVALMTATTAAKTGRAHMTFATEKLNALEARTIELAERVDGVLEEAKQDAKAGDDAVRDGLAARIGETETKLTGVGESTENLDAAQQRLSTQIETTEAKLAEVEEATEGLDAAQQRLATQAGATETKLAEVEESVRAGDEALTGKIAAAEQRSADRAQEFTRQAEGLKQQIAGLESKLGELAQELGRTDKDLRAVEIDAGQMRQDLDAIDVYVKETFQARLDAAMQAFDGTVTGVLGEMKDELLRGVDRIEEIEAVVAGRNTAQDRLLSEPDESAHEIPEPGAHAPPTDAGEVHHTWIRRN